MAFDDRIRNRRTAIAYLYCVPVENLAKLAFFGKVLIDQAKEPAADVLGYVFAKWRVEPRNFPPSIPLALQVRVYSLSFRSVCYFSIPAPLQCVVV